MPSVKTSPEATSPKPELSGQDDISCAAILKVLADETRLAVVRQLMDGPKHVGEMNAHMGVEQTLFSHHLRSLRKAQIVISQRDGKAVLYRLSPQVESKRRGRVLELGCCRLDFN